jgi:glycosyltransferase involved in cell wall biosynthesis
MKLLVVDHNALDPIHRLLYEELSRKGNIDIRLLVPSEWFDGYRMLRGAEEHPAPKLSVYPCNVLFKTRTHRLIYRGLAEHLKAFAPDILYMNSEPENFQTLQGARLVGDASLKFIFSSWRNIDHRAAGFPYKFGKFHAYAERTVLRRANHAILFNKDGTEIYRQLGFDATTYIPPYVDVRYFFPKPEGAHDTNSPWRICYIGRFITEKGLDTLLKAAANLTFPYSISLIGDGPAKTEWEQLARTLGIEQNVLWIPPVLHSEVPNRLHEADVVVLPSKTGKMWKEQFGRVIIEAMACGVPVVGSDSGEIPKVIGDAGMVFPEGSEQALKEKLAELHADMELRDQLVSKGLQRLNSEYSLERAINSYLQVFNGVIASA